MNEVALYNNYAIALLEVAIEEGKVQEYRKEIKVLKEVFKTNFDYVRFLGDYNISLSEKYKTIDSDMKKTVEKVISTTVNISNIFDKATPDKQNQLLRLLITDCQLNGKRLEYKLKAPFDKLIMCKNYQDWSQVAVENLGEFEKICC